MWHWFNKKFLPVKFFYQTSSVLLPWLIISFVILFSYGMIAGLFFAPADYQQGDGFRIMYVHVPSCFLAMGIYFVMAVSAFLTLVFRIKIAAICMSCSAPIGAWFTFLALVTGSIWETHVGNVVDLGCTTHVCFNSFIFIFGIYCIAIGDSFRECT